MLFTVKKRKTLSLFEGLIKNTTKELKLKLGKKTYVYYKYYLCFDRQRMICFMKCSNLICQ